MPYFSNSDGERDARTAICLPVAVAVTVAGTVTVAE